MNTRSVLTSLLRQLGLYRFASIAYYSRLARQHNMTLSVSGDVMSITNGNRRICIDAKHPYYAPDMIRWFDYNHSAVKAVAADGILVADYSAPRLHRLPVSGIDFAFPSLPESEGSIKEYMDALHVKAGDAVFDLGAYAGATTYFLSKAVGEDGLVFALEPDEVNFRYLEDNVARHNLKNVKCLQYGIWDRKTVVHFQSEGSLGSGVATLLRRGSNLKEVSMLTLQDVAEMASGRRIAGIKMDIEGSEVPVLRSAREFLVQHRPTLVVEPHYVDGKMVTDEVSGLLGSYGFETEVLTSQGTQDWPLVVAKPKESR
jgi:FkbM family methyltransferase